jgi:hypothetical protein
MMLKDAPGGADFIDQCVAAAADMSLRFVGTDDEQMVAALADVRENLKAQLAPTLGIEVGYTVAEAFVACVAGRKREIEAAAGGQKEYSRNSSRKCARTAGCAR